MNIIQQLKRLFTQEAMEKGMTVLIWQDGTLVDHGMITKLDAELIHIEGRKYKRNAVFINKYDLINQ